TFSALGLQQIGLIRRLHTAARIEDAFEQIASRSLESTQVRPDLLALALELVAIDALQLRVEEVFAAFLGVAFQAQDCLWLRVRTELAFAAGLGEIAFEEIAHVPRRQFRGGAQDAFALVLVA